MIQTLVVYTINTGAKLLCRLIENISNSTCAMTLRSCNEVIQPHLVAILPMANIVDTA